MDKLQTLKAKLAGFIRKFYYNELLKGLILFVTIGILYLLFTLFLESLLWLNSLGRGILFWAFVMVELILLVFFIIWPLLKLFRITKGIENAEASRIIGKHFPEVSDKLLNLLQLSNSQEKSDLLLASIDQKAEELQPVPFSLAINFRKSLSYLKYAAIPALIVLVVVFSGRSDTFSGSYKRVVNYKLAYAPPAPFRFDILNQDLEVRQGGSISIRAATVGKLNPEQVSINFDGQSYFMKPVAPGIFEFNFEAVNTEVQFNFSANDISSSHYKLRVRKVPKMLNLQMILMYPAYTRIENEILEGTGNASVPEGTKITWELETAETKKVEFTVQDSVEEFEESQGIFSLQKLIVSGLKYTLSTSNDYLQNFEQLAYQINSIKDEYPTLQVERKLDSVNPEIQYLYGRYSDDYGISNLSLVVEAIDSEKKVFRRNLPVKNDKLGEFLSVFPDTLELQEGKDYKYHYEVVDNDAVNGPKIARSQEFFFRKNTAEERLQENLENQRETIDKIGDGLQEMRESKQEIEDFQDLPKQKSELNYNDRKKLEDFLQRQKQQNKMMEKFMQRLQENLSEETDSEENDLKEELDERLGNREREIKENERLLEELEEFSQKIKEEGLQQKLDELSNRAKSQERSLEQLLELTKKYYVQAKLSQLSQKLDDLAQAQQKISEEENVTSKVQDSLNAETQQAFKQLEEVGEENAKLQKPVQVENTKAEQEEVSKEQKEASDKLQEQKKDAAQEHQKKAAERLKEMSANLKKGMEKGGQQQMQEDAKTLRQILSNLVRFSFVQEELMEQVKKSGTNEYTFSSQLRKQDQLRENFKHINDSLYALGMRNEMIKESINNKITNVDYNIEQALERLSQNEVRTGIASQQYVMAGANDLAVLLDDILSNMEDSLGASGGGEGEKQLQDIIQQQQELNEEIQEKMEGEQNGKGEEPGSEEEQGELFRIFQEQQMLRKALEERLEKDGTTPGGEAAKKEMKKLEEQLLDGKFDERLSRQMQRLEYKLLELEEGMQEQGQKPQRESTSGKDLFENKTKPAAERAKEYFNTLEILNRQSLPLRPVYRLKVKDYFDRRDN